MDAIELRGKPVSDNIYSEISHRIKKLSNKNIKPKLAAILIGNNPASEIYVNTKNRMFSKMGCSSKIYHLNSNIDQNELLNLIKNLNNDTNVHGILLQLPIPEHFNSNEILRHINPSKDVDGFHPENLGYLLQGSPRFIPCTPYGCIEILKYYKINLKSKHVVIVGRSNIVGKPLMALLSQKFSYANATVTICHSYTTNLSRYTSQADILIAATGIPNLISKDMVKKDVVIIDVGINRIEDDSDKGYYIAGDVNYKDVLDKASAITPVPGGVGPMTIAMLLYNTVIAAEATII